MAPIQTQSNISERDAEIDIGGIFRTLTHQWRLIAIVTAVGTLLALRSVLVSHPQFTIDGSLYLGDAQSSAAGGATGASGISFLSDFQSVSDVETQIALLRSKALLEQAITETGLNASITPVGQSPLSFWRWRFDDGKSIGAYAQAPDSLQVNFATILNPASNGASYVVVFDKAGQYRLVTGGGIFSPAKTVLTGNLGQPASGAGVVFLLKSSVEGYAPAEGTKYDLSISPAKSVADDLLGGPLTVGAGGSDGTPTKLADIALLWNNPYQAQTFVNQLMNDFIATQLLWKTQSASATEKFVAGQLKNITASLADADEKLAAYQSKTGIVSVPANAQAIISQLSQYEVQRTAIALQQEALQQLETATAHPTGEINPYLVSQTSDPQLSQLALTLATAEVQLQGQRTQFTGSAPEVQQQEASISKIEQAMYMLIVNDEALQTRNLANIDKMIATFQGQLKSMPAEALQVIALTRSSEVFGQLYVLLMQKEEEAEVSKAATIVDTRIVTPAELPLASTTPKAALTIFTGFFLGLSLGIVGVLGRRAISGRFHSDDEIRNSVPLPVYALIPKRNRSDISRSIFSERSQSPFAEAFRLLRSNIYQSGALSDSKVILVTSGSSGDGKTTISSNLAKILADDGRRVVLVDGDLHRGCVHEVLSLHQAPGLTESLLSSKPALVQKVDGESFDVLTAGVFPPNPSELLNSSALKMVFETLKQEYDFVIVDCPPLPAISDTMSIGQFGDLMLSVVHLDHTLRRAFAIHNETIATLARRRGIIINAVSGSAYGYGYGYGYGSAEDGPQTWLARARRYVSNLFER